MSFQITVFRYTGSIHPHSLQAKTKGEISYTSKGKLQFDILAPNDETAMAYINQLYFPEDIRPLHGVKILADFCKSSAKAPDNWTHSINSLMEA